MVAEISITPKGGNALKRILCLIAGCALLLTACAKEAPPDQPVPNPPVSSMPAPAEPSREPEPVPPEEIPAPSIPAFPEEDEPSISEPESIIDPASEAARLSAGQTASNGTAPEAAALLSQDDALDSERIELELLRLINKEREQYGVPVLGMQDSMRWAAQMRAAEIIEQMSHTRPDDSPYHTAFDEAGFVYAGKWHGENISCIYFPVGACDENSAAWKIFDALSQSSGHHQNMIGENFAQAGIGAYVVTNKETVTVASAQLFASL